MDWSFTITLDQFSKTQKTDEAGCTTFTDLSPGEYIVSENPIPSGWQAIDPISGERTVVVVEREETLVDTFYNYETGRFNSVCGYKFEDEDANPLTANLLGLEGWTIDLSEMNECVEANDEWADTVVSYDPGTRKDGSTIKVQSFVQFGVPSHSSHAWLTIPSPQNGSTTKVQSGVQSGVPSHSS